VEMIDTHFHLWDLGNLTYSFLQEVDPGERAVLGDYDAIRKNYLIGNYLEDIKGSEIVKAVHVQAAVGHSNPVEETAWLQGIADVAAIPQGIIGFCNLCGDNVDAVLDGHQQYGNFRGVRMLATAGVLLERDFVRGFSRLAARGLTYELEATAKDFRDAVTLAGKFPDISIVLEHTGLPMERTTEYFQMWRKEIAVLTDAENVVCKISGLGMTDHHWSVASIRPWIEVCINSFGPERCMFGTNWPVDSLYSSYRTVVEAYRAITSPLSVDEQRQLLVKTAERTYRI
jgi:predicted TIM-barrel fold metal-dependent hydrolase